MTFGKSVFTRFIEIFVIIIIMVVLMSIYSNILTRKQIKSNEEIKAKKLETIFKDVDNSNYALMDKYTMYGTHLNIGGYITNDAFENINIEGLNLVLKNIDNEDKVYKLKYGVDDEKIKFTLSENINEGINLEDIIVGEYYIYIKVYGNYNEKEISKYFSIKNITNYSNNEYYTITENNENRKIDINFAKYKKEDNDIEYMQIISIPTILPQDVYDIVLDPGHGGRDSGAIYNNEKESEYTLDYCLTLKEKLESLGYKVKLTRTKDEYTAPYGENGRAIVPYETKAKLFLSIHLNSTESKNSEGGLEVYLSNHANLSFANSFAKNIKEMANTTYSPNNVSKVADGVYVRTYNEAEVDEAIEYAKEIGYEPYKTLSTETPYLFVIRETGGIMTHAYVDGRNKTAGDNPYHKSNIGAESYLLELGFINSKKDLENIKNNKEAYIDAIVKTIVDNYKGEVYEKI